MPSHVMIAKKERTFVFTDSRKISDATIKILRFLYLRDQFQTRRELAQEHAPPTYLTLIYEPENQFSTWSSKINLLLCLLESLGHPKA